MRSWKLLALPVFAAALLSSTSSAPAQISVSIGAAPVCPYGYYDYAPYNCAPYGFYGPEWFSGGVFIGAGPWYHGSAHFYGHVDDHFDPHHGYRGSFPARSEHPDPARFQHFQGHPEEFHGGGFRDGRGHEGRPH